MFIFTRRPPEPKKLSVLTEYDMAILVLGMSFTFPSLVRFTSTILLPLKPISSFLYVHR